MTDGRDIVTNDSGGGPHGALFLEPVSTADQSMFRKNASMYWSRSVAL